MRRRSSSIVAVLVLTAAVLFGGVGQAGAQLAPNLTPLGMPDYFGTTPNWALSPMPVTDVAVVITDSNGAGASAQAVIVNGAIASVTLLSGGTGYLAPSVAITSALGTGATATATVTGGVITAINVTAGGSGYVKAGTGIRKFVDGLPGLGAGNANNLGNYIPLAKAMTPPTGVPNDGDYYEIGLRDYTMQFHSDLPKTTRVRGYYDLNPTGDGNNHYLGPIIIAQRNRPVRVKFVNKLPAGAAGNLFIPVDTTVMGAGMGPDMDINNQPIPYQDNRATLHLHGGNTPWISDGTPHQWTVPFGDTAAHYQKGVSAQDVPDMPPAGQGALNFYYTNQQSARLMFYHDHAYGTTRLNVYVGEAAGYLLIDSNEESLITAGIIPGQDMVAAGHPEYKYGIPLVIQDKSFVPDALTLAQQDPTWDSNAYGALGNFWFPHVYMPNQNPYVMSGANDNGRWDYGPWFWPPFTGLINGPVANPLGGTTPTEGPVNPGTPNPSLVPEAFMDTPLVNGQAYPYMNVEPKAYRFRILNACNDRNLNLSLFVADANNATVVDGNGVARGTEVIMVPAVPHSPADTTWPATWPTDGRDGGVPDPKSSGPSWYQIGNEAGLIANVAVIPPMPVGYEYNRRNIVVLNVLNKGLFFGPAERADVIVDFSAFAGKTVILYNDSPAPVPAFDPRIDYYTGAPDQTFQGGAPPPLPGFGPNTRTIMQFRVSSATPTTFNLAALQTALPVTYGQSQEKPIVPQSPYNAAFAGAAYPTDAYVRIQDTTILLSNGGVGSVTVINAGRGYTTAPTVTFTGTGTGAAATATLAPSSITTLTLVSGGSGFTSAPTITFTGGGGTGAAATAALSPTGVASVVLGSGGTGYTVAPAVGLTGGGGTGATATAALTPTSVASFTVTAGGTGFTSVPTVALTGGGGTGAAGTAVLSPGTVGSVAVTAAGAGFTSAPTVTFTGGGGTGATATAALTPAGVAGFTLTSGGTGFTAAPTVGLTGGGGTGATATAALTPTSVASLALTAGGTGFTSVPTVSLTGGGGTGATATATLAPGPVGSVVLTTGGAGYTAPPTVTLTGGGGTGATATAVLAPGGVAGVTITAGGAGYTSAPTVAFTGGGGTGAAGVATLGPGSVVQATVVAQGTYTSPPSILAFGGGGTGASFGAVLTGGRVTSVTVLAGGSGYTSAPTLLFFGGGGFGATATATIARPVSGVTMTAVGTGYTSLPTVAFTGGGGTGAAGTARLSARAVASVTLAAGGAGYTTVPTVGFAGGGGTGAAATATLAPRAVASVTRTAAGTGYTSAPTVGFTGGGGTGAAATATLTATSVASVTLTAAGSGYTAAPTVSFTGTGTGAAATARLSPTTLASVTVTAGGTGYTAAPTVGFTGGGGTGAAGTATLTPRSVASVTRTAGGTGYTSAPTVGFTGGGGTGAAATATLTPTSVASVTVTAAGSGYTGAPTVSFTGTGTGAAATARLSPTSIASLTLTAGGTGYTSSPTVVFTGGAGTGATATAAISASVASITVTAPGTGYTSAPAVTLSGGGGTGATAIATMGGTTLSMLPKAIQELFEVNYGRMNAILGVELPFTNMTNQTTIPFAYIDPPTEIFHNSDPNMPIGSLGDGTQIWKITHNGVDTHAIHFHLFNVQLINRVGWDGAIRVPDINEIGWKETIRMHPLEDAIVALRPYTQKLPFQLPNSLRPLDVTAAPGTSAQFTGIDTAGQPVTVPNQTINFGFEYVWHCHLLGHEENDMMRPMSFAVAPIAPSTPVAARVTGNIRVTWTDNSMNETGFTVQRATSATGPWTTLPAGSVAGVPGTGSTVTFTDTTGTGGTTYYYRVIANNVVGLTQVFTAPAVGYPPMSVDSAPTAASNGVTR